LNGAGQIAFAAKLTHPGVNLRNDYGIWAESIDGELTLIVRTGELLEVAPGDFRTIDRFQFIGSSGNQDGRNSLFNERGQLAFGATFTDGTSGIFVSNAVAIPEPAALGLLLVGVMFLIGRRSRS
jgi:hypothetical protein